MRMYSITAAKGEYGNSRLPAANRVQLYQKFSDINEHTNVFYVSYEIGNLWTHFDFQILVLQQLKVINVFVN